MKNFQLVIIVLVLLMACGEKPVNGESVPLDSTAESKEVDQSPPFDILKMFPELRGTWKGTALNQDGRAVVIQMDFCQDPYIQTAEVAGEESKSAPVRLTIFHDFVAPDGRTWYTISFQSLRNGPSDLFPEIHYHPGLRAMKKPSDVDYPEMELVASGC